YVLSCQPPNSTLVPYTTLFRSRDGAHLSCEFPIPMTMAALGGSIEVPTIEGGRSKIKIPEGTQPDKVFRLREKGMSVLRQSRRRSEEHTSELQSREKLVCRLLL